MYSTIICYVCMSVRLDWTIAIDISNKCLIDPQMCRKDMLLEHNAHENTNSYKIIKNVLNEDNKMQLNPQQRNNELRKTNK